MRQGTDAFPLTEGRTKVWSPTWSNDGRTVFYVSNRGGSMDLWQQTVTNDGRATGEPLSLTQGLNITSAAFSPDRAKLAYARGGRVSNVWRVPITSHPAATWAEAERVTSEHAYIEFVDVSPDGKHLAVSSDRRGNQDLWLLPSSGGEMTPLTNDPTPDWNPRWSPDGSQLAFYSYRGGNRDIWVMPSRGGPARQLTSHARHESFPVWSPDGHEIAFRVNQEGTTFIVSAAGGEPRRVVTLGAASVHAWSPDKQSLVVVRQGRLLRVPTNGGEPVLLPTPHRANTARFSAGGESIDYSVVEGPREHHGHWRLSLKDGVSARLTELNGQRGRMGYMFSADARFLYFTWYEDEGDMWVMDVAADDAR